MRDSIGCHVEPIPNTLPSSARREADIIGLSLRGVRCPNCANRVRNALLGCPGVVDAVVDLAAAHAEVWYRPDQVGPTGLRRVVSKAGSGTHHRYLAVPVRSLFPRKRGVVLEKEDAQVADITVQDGYDPERLFLQPGCPILLRFTRLETSACSERVEFPDLGISRQLPQGERVTVDLGAMEPGEYSFQCHMGRLRGALVVQSEGLVA